MPIVKVGTLVSVAFIAFACSGCLSTGSSLSEHMLLKPVKEFIDGPGTQEKLVSGVKKGPYEASTLAIGVEKDLSQTQGRGLGYVRQEEVEAYLEQIRLVLVTASGVTNMPGSIRILATPSLDAHSTADGNLFVSMAWLNVAETEDEIAAIVAHELAHVLLHHHSSDILKNAQRQFESVSQIGIFTKTALRESKSLSAADSKLLRNLQLGVELMELTLFPAWSRRQETEADLLAVDLLDGAGYSTISMYDMLSKLEAWERGTAPSRLAFEERLAAAAQQSLQDALSLTWDELVSTLEREHPETDKRLTDVGAYLDRHYGEVAMNEPRREAWLKLVKRRSVRNVLTNYDRAFSASKLLQKGEVKSAYLQGKKSVQALPKHAYPNWITAKAATMMGNRKEAINYLSVAIKSTEPTSDMYQDLVALNESTGKHDEALKLVDAAEQKFGGSPDWIPDRIRLYRKMGKKGDMNVTLLKCTVNHPQLKRQCIEASIDPESRSAKGKT